ncbi:MAG: hypothetical protein Q9159_001069 [Coniocarpon cinnabarinum]
MPRPPVKRKHHLNIIKRVSGQSRGPAESATTRTIDYPTKSQLEKLAPAEREVLRQAQREVSVNASSDSDHLVRRNRQSSNAKSHDDPTLMYGALGATMSPKTARAHRRELESDATRRVRHSMHKDAAKQVLRKPSEKFHEKARSLRGKQEKTGDASSPLAWSSEEVTGSPITHDFEGQERDMDGSSSDPLTSTKKIKATKDQERRDPVNAPSRAVSKSRAAPSSKTSGAAAPKVPATPSFLAIANFKRRPRQPSLLSQVQRAESRRNSISTVGSREHPADLDQDEQDDSVLTFRDIDAPEDVALDIAETEPPRTSSSRKRKRLEANVDVQMEASQSPGSSPPDVALSSEHHSVEQSPELDIDGVIANSQPKRPRTSHASSRDSQHTTYSSPPASHHRTSQQLSSQPRTRRHPPRTPARLSSPVDATSPLSTPDSSPIQPDQPDQPISTSKPAPSKSSNSQNTTRKSTAAAKSKKAEDKPLTSTELTAFLPRRTTRRRQRRKRDEFQVLSTDDEDEERSELSEVDAETGDESSDELAASSRARRNASSRILKAKDANAKMKTKTPVKSPANLHNKEKQKKNKTYGRRSEADFEPENEAVDHDSQADTDHEDESTDHVTSAKKGRMGQAKASGKSREIQAAKAKFEEVDEWELSFESADIGAGGDSSPWR